MAEAEAVGIESFEALNDRFMAWAEQAANTRTHAETNQMPLARFLAAGPPRAVDPAVVADAFRWSALRLVTKTASISLAGNSYQVDPVLVGRRVECRYDPTDMSSSRCSSRDDRRGWPPPRSAFSSATWGRGKPWPSGLRWPAWTWPPTTWSTSPTLPSGPGALRHHRLGSRWPPPIP